MSSLSPVSIVIPTHDRAATLRVAVEALFHQSAPAGSELVIVDDGSQDGSRAVIEELAARAPMPVRYLAQPASGPAAARNRGVRHAVNPIVLFLGDDIIAQPNLIDEHLTWHQRYPDPLVAVLGFVTWSPALTVTPYMRWLEASGNQFDFERIRGVEDIDPARFLYTSNLSFKRDLLLNTGEWFDERFRHAMLEDIDLGRRLAARGLKLKYNPRAVGHHDHAVTLDRYVRRIELTSHYWVLLEGKREPDAGAAAAPAAAKPVERRRDYRAYAWFLTRVCGEVIRNWPFWQLARFLERRKMSPGVFERAHRHWAQRGLIKVEVGRAVAKLRKTRPSRLHSQA